MSTKPAVTAASLHERFVRPLVPSVEGPVGEGAGHLASAIAGGAALFVESIAPQAFGEDLALDFSDDSVHRLGAALDRRRRDAWMAASEEEGADSVVAIVAIHAAFYVGECIVRRHGGAWSIRTPLWESLVKLESRAGVAALSPFAWTMRALSDDEIDRAGLVARYRAYVERATFDPSALPPIVTTRLDRALPALKIVRYDTLHKHLRAHLPELRDLGRDFPTPEQFAELGFLTLEMLLLGEGRVLLMHGRGKRGLHLFWLDRGGLTHGAFFPASPGDPHTIVVEGDTLRLSFVSQGRPITHEMLWWG